MATIEDVARDAGVSVSTVSYALSGKRSISAETRERIARSIERLGYRPNATARALASNRTNALALIAPLRADNNVPVVMNFVAAVATAARERDHDVLLLAQEEGEEGVLRVSQSALVDAVIVMDVEEDDARLPVLREVGLSSVLIGHPKEPSGFSWVDFDFRQAAVLCVEHLVELGHRTICMLGSPAAVYRRRSSYALAFASGFEAATRRLGVEARWYPTEAGYGHASELVERELTEHPETTALLVHNEGVLGAVLATLRRMSRDVPGDVSVAAICPEDMALHQSIELTGVSVPAEQIGRAAVELVLRQIDGGVAETRLIGPRLTVRSSTAPPPA